MHLQSLQLTSLSSFSLTLVLCLMKLNKQHAKSKRHPTLEQFSYKTHSFQDTKTKSLPHKDKVYLISQIGNLTLEPLNLPPQVFFFLIHSLSVTPLFPEVFFKDLHLENKM